MQRVSTALQILKKSESRVFDLIAHMISWPARICGVSAVCNDQLTRRVFLHGTASKALRRPVALKSK